MSLVGRQWRWSCDDCGGTGVAAQIGQRLSADDVFHLSERFHSEQCPVCHNLNGSKRLFVYLEDAPGDRPGRLMLVSTWVSLRAPSDRLYTAEERIGESVRRAIQEQELSPKKAVLIEVPIMLPSSFLELSITLDGTQVGLMLVGQSAEDLVCAAARMGYPCQ